MNTEEQLEAELGRRDFYEFVKMAWHQVEPVTYVDNWHIELECRALEAVTRGHIQRLIINVPPGTGKSLIVSVLWPAWQWEQDPGHRFMRASFDQSLVNRDAGKVLQLVQGDWFKARWPNIVPANDRFQPVENPPVSRYWTTKGGLSFSTSIKGKATGFHAHTHIVDDPIKPRDANNRATTSDKGALQDCIDWWKETMPMRAVDLATLRKVIIMQRLHENDLVGYVEENEPGWVKLCLPMRYEEQSKCCIDLGNGETLEDPRTKEGELLFPKRFPEKEVKNLETTMGSRVAAAQLQQRPSAQEGNMFKRRWFKHYDYVPQNFAFLIQSWDMSFKGTDGTDFVVGDLWGVIGADAYLLPGWIQERLSFTETVKAMVQFGQRDLLHRRAYLKLVEDKANGPAVVDSLRKQVPGLVLVNPDGGKESRASAVTPFYEAGNVWHPSKHLDPRIQQREDTLAAFPNARHDDPVDTTSQALLRLFVRSANLVQAMQNVFSGQGGVGQRNTA